MTEGPKNTRTMHKKQHPRETANIISRIFFCWPIPTFVRGFRKDFDEGDLYGPLSEHKSCLLGDKLESAWNGEVDKSKPSLSRALFRVFALDVIWTGVLLVIIECLKVSQPICLGILITYYIPNQTTVTKEEAYASASFIVVISLCNTLLGHWYMLYLQHLGMKMRVACSAVIYRKSLKLNKTALIATTIGQLVNLLSNDVSRFDYGMTHFHALWVGPLETLIILGFLYYQVGVSGITGVLFLILFIPLQMYLGKKSSQYRLKIALKTDERVHLMSEIISGMQVIKMYTWEKPFAKLVEMARKREIKLIRATSYIKAILLSLVMFNARFAIFLTILTYVLIGGIPNAKFVFVVTAFYNVIRQSLVQSFPRAITQTAETLISVRRLEKFLLYDEVQVKAPRVSSPKTPVGVNLEEVTANWSNTEKTLCNINLLVNSRELTAVIGGVGSGKTSLLHVILEEIPGIKGSVVVNGRISYASQEPWLFSGTIKENILFGQPLNIKRYREVVKSCDLERDFSVFTYGDNTTVGERGVTLSGGQRARISLARALYRDADVYLLDDPLSAVDAQVGKRLFEEAICGFLNEKCTILVTHQLQFLAKVDKIVVLENGRVTAAGSYEELQNSGKDFSKLLSDATNKEKIAPNTTEGKEIAHKNIEQKENAPAQNKEMRSAGNIKKKVYKSYIKAGGRYWYTFLLLLTFFMAQMSASGADYFISFWVNIEEERTTHTNETPKNGFFMTENSVYVYSSIVAAVVIVSLTRSISFFKYCMRASTNLHNNMFNKIVYGKMSFFNTNPSGRILNRFSKDMGSIDEVLPSVIVDTLQNGLSVLGICIVIAVVNFWILIPTLIIFVLFYMLRVVYLATSRNIKRLEGTTKSPVFTHLSSTLQGLTTIRAFSAQDVLKMEFDNHQDMHSSAYYLFLGCTRTFGFWIDFLCVIYIGLVTMSFLLMGTETHGGNVGLAITQAVGLTGMLQWGMRQWSELENQMTAVERVVEYTEIEHEVDEGTKQPSESWPTNGCVEFKNVSLRYSPKDHYILKNISFKVHGGEKIGIVGRTGAGKSSIIIALFQIAETEGDIIIDGLHIKEVPLRTTRSKISIIPQEPVLFSSTLRKNLDPFDEYKDDEIWKALEEVELKNLATDLPSGLDSKISEGGSNLSVGQRQLLCLARAVLRKNKILVLDEATANVDPKTDFFIQKTIREKFSKCTVLTIAHRLHTVIDSDKILVVDNGKVAAFDHPSVLMCDREGIFYKLVEQTGEAMTNSLLEIAKKVR